MAVVRGPFQIAGGRRGWGVVGEEALGVNSLIKRGGESAASLFLDLPSLSLISPSLPCVLPL